MELEVALGLIIESKDPDKVSRLGNFYTVKI